MSSLFQRSPTKKTIKKKLGENACFPQLCHKGADNRSAGKEIFAADYRVLDNVDCELSLRAQDHHSQEDGQTEGNLPTREEELDAPPGYGRPP